MAVDNRDLFEEVLSVLHRSGVLQELVLLGSWCLAVYREYFGHSPEIPLLRTLDVDFLIPNPPKITNSTDVPNLLEQLDFDAKYSVLGGFCKFVHPDLEIEFLTPEMGRGRSTPYKVPALRIVAQGLRYISLAQKHATAMHYKGVPVRVPEPAAFVLLKFLTSSKRKGAAKQERDILTAIQLTEFLLRDPSQTVKLLEIYSSLPDKWQTSIYRIVQNTYPYLARLFKGE